MSKLFNLENYKSHLIEYYRHNCDEDKVDERRKHINRYYTDDYLMNIINNTQNCIIWLLEKIKNEINIDKDHMFFEIELPMLYHYIISNNCSGGGACDTLFYIDDKKEETLVSEDLIKEFFGEKFNVSLGYNEYDSFDQNEDAGHEYEIPTLNISGPLNEFNKVYEQYSISFKKEETQRDLVRVLKQINKKK